MPMLNNIPVWLQQRLKKIRVWLQQRPEVRIIVCLFSCGVGLLCFALSSTFLLLFGHWFWWKSLRFTVFSCIVIILLVVLLVKGFDRNKSHKSQVRVNFWVLLITTVWSKFVDEKVDVKPDVYSLVSYSSFAIMSLALSTLTQYGFEDELLHFFTCFLTLQLMKINFWLVIVGGAFMYFLIMLCFYLDPALPTSGTHAPRNPPDIERGNLLLHRTRLSDSQVYSPRPDYVRPRTRHSGSQVDTSQGVDVRSENEDVRLLPSAVNSSQVVDDPLENEQGNSNNSDIITRFKNCIKEAETKDESALNDVMNVVVDERQFSELQRHSDHTLVMDSYRPGIIDNLRESAGLMVEAGFENKCLEEYISWRRKFLNEILLRLPSPNLNMEEIDDTEKIKGWLQTLTVAVRILFPNEKRLCDRVFESYYSSDRAFTEVCKKLATRLLSTCYALATWSRFTPTTLENLMQEFEFKFLFSTSESSLGNEASQIRKILGNSENLNSLINRDAAQATIAGGIHSITREVMDYIRDVFKNNGNSILGRCFEEYANAAKPSEHLAMILELLESSLEATSKNCENPSLGYVFIMNNRKFIADEAELLRLKPIISSDWLKRNQEGIEENLQLYLRRSWDEILNILKLKLDINESEPIKSVTGLVEDMLNSFNQHFEDICKDQSTWVVSDGMLRKQIIKSIADILLPPYGNFIDLLSTLGRCTNTEHKKFKISDVEDALNKLFVGEPHEVDAGREGKKNA